MAPVALVGDCRTELLANIGSYRQGALRYPKPNLDHLFNPAIRLVHLEERGVILLHQSRSRRLSYYPSYRL